MKKRQTFVVITLFLLITGCSPINVSRSDDTTTIPENLISNQGKIEARLEALGRTNLEWLARAGWVHYERIPVEEGIVKFTYQNRWTYYFNQEGECSEELWIIKRTKDSTEGQRRVRLADGTQGELIALRTGGEIPSYADPTQLEKVTCRAEERSAPVVDLIDFQSKSDYVEELQLWEEQMDGRDVVVFQAIYMGTDTNLLGIPTDAEGKLEQIYYDAQTGNRVKMLIKIYYQEDGWKGETWTEEQYSYYEELPEVVAEELQQSKKELEFYLDVLSRD